HRPALIVRCASAGDVEATVRFARARELPLSVRAGGHSLGGFSVVPKGVVIDLRGLNQISVEGDVASVGSGCTYGALLAALGSTRGTPGGFDPRVGVAGLTLGGGYGMLTRLHGLAADNLIGAEVVLASGERVQASERELPELLWALRGAGANFGAVTSMRLRLHALPPLTTVQVLHSLDSIEGVLARYEEAVAGASDQTTVYLGLECAPDGGGSAQLIGFHFGSAAEGERALAPFTRLGNALVARVAPASYA